MYQKTSLLSERTQSCFQREYRFGYNLSGSSMSTDSDFFPISAHTPGRDLDFSAGKINTNQDLLTSVYIYRECPINSTRSGPFGDSNPYSHRKLFSLTPPFMSVVTVYKYIVCRVVCALASFCVTGFDIIGPVY